MSTVAFARAVRDGLRRHGIKVTEHEGWERRGNGQSWPVLDGLAGPDGILTHHTGAPVDGGLSVLVSGRRDLPGPLCNMATRGDGSVILIAAQPANHAGASGGRSMGPLPTTRSFNRRVWGNEIMYPGSQPMTAAQRRTSLIMAGVVCGIRKRPNPDWARGHGETSVTGKWDPGHAPGRMIDMNAHRGDIWSALHEGAVALPVPSGRTHTVVRGDTLWGLSRRYGVTVAALRSHNQLTGDHLAVGQTVRIP